MTGDQLKEEVLSRVGMHLCSAACTATLSTFELYMYRFLFEVKFDFAWVETERWPEFNTRRALHELSCTFARPRALPP